MRIDDGQFYSYATGSIIAVQPGGEALIITCGHVFRESQGRGAIAVDLFGAHRQSSLPGRLVAYDLNHDLAVVSVRVPSGVSAVAFVEREAYVREGQRVFSVGCDRGAEPGLREGRIAGVNRYLGTPNLVATGRPVVGRSGGGLFDAEGRLIGVCRAADGQADEGVYVSYQAVHAQSATRWLRRLRRPPSRDKRRRARPRATSSRSR
jgi:S1-C subfamily serine protease